jgi:hypothetical protein
MTAGMTNTCREVRKMERTSLSLSPFNYNGKLENMYKSKRRQPGFYDENGG